MELQTHSPVPSPSQPIPDEPDFEQRHNGFGFIQILGLGLLAFTFLIGLMGIVMVAL